MPGTLIDKINALAEKAGDNDRLINQRITNLAYSLTLAVDDMARTIERQVNVEAWAVENGYDPSTIYTQSESGSA